MAAFLARLEWIKNKGRGDTQVIDNWKTINVRIASELKNNRMTINLTNDFGRASPRKYNNSQGSIVGEGAFQVDDKFKLYAKYDSDNSGLDLSDDSSDLVFFGDLRPIKSKVKDKADIRLTCTDRTFNILNKLDWPKYTSDNAQDSLGGQGWTAPLMIQDIIRKRAGTNKTAISENELVYDEDGNLWPADSKNTAFYLIDARLASEGGFIQDNRSISIDKNGDEVSRTIGTPDSDTSLFPTIPIATQNFNFPFQDFVEVGKPIYELFLNLSQIDLTNTVDELDPDNASFDPIIQRAMRFYVDEKNKFHWFYPTNTIDSDKFLNELDITMGDVANGIEVKSHDLDYDIFDVINFIYFEAGIDMNGNSILGFNYDSTSGAPTLKESKRSWPRISENMKDEDDIEKYPDGNITFDSSLKAGYAFPVSYGSGITPRWNPRITVTNNAEYNTAFKNEARRRADSKADLIIKGASSQRWKGTIEFRFHNFTVTDLMNYTSEAGGIANQKLRIKEVNHNFQKAASFTTITVEEDGKELEA